MLIAYALWLAPHQHWCYTLLNKWVLALLGNTVGVCVFIWLLSLTEAFVCVAVWVYVTLSTGISCYLFNDRMQCNCPHWSRTQRGSWGSHLTCWREPLCLFVLRIIIPGLNWSSYWTWLWLPLFIQCTTLLKIRAPYHSYSWRFMLNH